MAKPTRHVECTIPVLRVADVVRAATFYTETLGFVLDWKTATICSVSRDQCHIMLSQGIQSSGPGLVWIGLEDHSLFDEYKRRGVIVVQEPRNFTWAYEMKFADPDGNILWVGTETRADLPVEG